MFRIKSVLTDLFKCPTNANVVQTRRNVCGAGRQTSRTCSLTRGNCLSDSRMQLKLRVSEGGGCGVIDTDVSSLIARKKAA